MNETQRDRIAEGLRTRLERADSEERFGAEEALRRVTEAPPALPAEHELTPQALAGLIDHTALKPQTTEADVRQLCKEARRYGFASVCINPCYIELAAADVWGTDVKVCTVVGFPLGATLSTVKAAEAQRAVEAGADELDVVLNAGLLKSGRHRAVEADVRTVVEAARAVSKAVLVKVILETALLTDEEKAIACVLADRAGAGFVKTSTGFSTGGATREDVALMRHMVGERLGVKASGGIRSFQEAQAMVEHGATRIGASASVAIVEGTVSSEGTY